MAEMLNLSKIQVAMIDLEKATWKAVREVLPHMEIHGCAFPWTQAVYRKIQCFGLGPAYTSKAKTAKFLRQLMCLHLLPAEQIPATLRLPAL